MKKETLLMVTFGAVAATAMVMGLRVSAEKDLPPHPTNFRNAEETAEERALHAKYLDHYSRRKFAPLLAMVGDALSETERARLGDLLARREIALAYARENATQANIAYEEYCDRQRAQLEKEISAACGTEISARVDEYIRTLPQRPMVGSINEILVYRGEGMSVAQMERLCALINRCDIRTPRRPPSRAEWDSFVAKKHAAFQEIAVASGEFLSPKQRETLQQEFDVQLSHLKMQRRMFDGPVEISGALDPNQNG